MKKKSKLKKELIQAIQNEDNYFDMSTWKNKRSKSAATPATCRTASCMAGHIEALRPKLAKKLAPMCTDQVYRVLNHEHLAVTIWEIETGQECRLDFHGLAYFGVCGLDEISRKEAIAHIKGRNRKWPLLSKVHL